jgi:hypothetical protein
VVAVSYLRFDEEALELWIESNTTPALISGSGRAS